MRFLIYIRASIRNIIVSPIDFGTSSQITIHVVMIKTTPLGNGQNINYLLIGPNLISATKIIKKTDTILSGVYSISNTTTPLSVNTGDMVICFTYITGDSDKYYTLSLKYNLSASVVFTQ